jgi:iron complex outermembrane receptor protein
MHVLNPISRGIGLSLLFSGSFSLLAHADEPTKSNKEAASKSTALEVVTVTAQRREETEQEVPAAIAVVKGEQLITEGARYIGDLTTFSPNVSAENPDGNSRPRWIIRGLGAGDTGAATVYPVGIYADDVYLNAPIAGSSALFDLERIEILRGPQGTLYGKNTTGGAVNILSQKPSLSAPTNGYTTLGLGTDNERIVDTALGGVLVEDRLAARLSLYSEERDGFTKNLTSDQTYGDENKKAGRLQILAKLNPDLEALWKVHSRVYKGDGSNGSLITGTYLGSYTRPDGRNIELNFDEDIRLEHDGTSLTFNYALGDYTLTSISAIDWIYQDSLLDSDYAPYTQNGYTDTSNDYRQYSQEFRLTSPQDELLRWIIGSHYFHEDLESSLQRIVPEDTLPNGVSNQANNATVYRALDYTHTTDSYALFGNLSYDFTEQFSLTGGLRWTLEEKDIDLDLTQLVRNSSTNELEPLATTASNGNSRKSESWDAFTYDLTPEYRINDNLRLYFRYAHGFRSGGFNTGLSSSLGQLTTVDPEYLDAYEIGLKSEWFNGRLHANANVFYYDYEDIQVNLSTFNNNVTTSALTNGAQGKVEGVELTLEAQPTDRLHLLLALAYLDTQYTDFKDRNPSTGAVTEDYDGNAFARAPHGTLGLGADYTFPLAVGGKLVLGSDYSYRTREWFLVNRQGDIYQRRMSQGSYGLLNARLSYFTQDEKYSVSAFVHNITDKLYLVQGRQNGNISLDQAVIVYGDPRTAGVSFTARY